MRRRYHDARHNVPCFVIGDDLREQWSSDDGEPQGTAGAPMLRLLEGEGITNTAAVVTRYFGGVKLGTGGLVRAYTAALRAGLDDAGVSEVTMGVALIYRMSYPSFEKMKTVASKEGWAVSGAEYGEDVTFTVSGPDEHEEAIRLAASSASGADTPPIGEGRAEIRRVAGA
jgi:putative IMPACT (imprinted ancient) family translation regulator